MRWGYHVKDGFKLFCVPEGRPWMEITGRETHAQNEEVLSPRALQRWEGLPGVSMSSHSELCLSKGWRTCGRRYGESRRNCGTR